VAPSLAASVPPEVAPKPLRVVVERGGTETTMPPLSSSGGVSVRGPVEAVLKDT
jgi:hypothetical protein